ncbi:MAG: hypothetical protein IPL65_19465 [Lewinellaceae bacterium]|nr:hypothetical protein [Lewinellaceae bacterium]
MEELRDKLEDYLSGKLGAAEKKALEQQLASDPALQEMLRWQKLERDAMDVLAEDDLRNDLLEWKKGLPANKSPKIVPIWSRYTIAIAAAVALILSIWWWTKPTTDVTIGPRTAQNQPVVPKTSPQASIDTPSIKPHTNPEKPIVNTPKALSSRYLALAESNYDALRNSINAPQVRGSKPEKDSTLSATQILKQDGFAAFNKAEYKACIGKLSKVPATDKGYFTTMEYLGHAYFRTKEFKKAAATFQMVYEQNLPLSTDRARWYYLLAMLADGKEDSASFKTNLNLLANDPSRDYSQQAQKLLEKLAPQR